MGKWICLVLALTGCSARGTVLNSEQTTKAIMVLGESYNDLARKHNALVDRVSKLEPAPKTKASK